VIDYDPQKPLFFLHLPKTGGTSVREIFKTWYKDNLLLHYYNEASAQMPQRYSLGFEENTVTSPVAIYGHFNRVRGFGIDQYYPNACQFITILRDPYERALSTYFYLRRRRQHFRDKSRIPGEDLREYLLKTNASIINQFPSGLSLSNYKEFIESRFIEVGLLECLDVSMQRIARKLNFNYSPDSVQLLNATPRPLSQRIPDELKSEYIKRKPIDYAIYGYIASKYGMPLAL
jgi:Sulfotransferase family.